MQSRYLRPIRLASALLAVALLMSCGSQAGPAPIDPTSVPPTALAQQPSGAVLGQPFTLKIGQSAMIASEALAVEFDSVLEDSRCPTKVNCAWIGRASISIGVRKAGQSGSSYILATISSPEKTDRATYGSYEIQLVGLTPQREYPDQKVDPRDYIVELQVAKLLAP